MDSEKEEAVCLQKEFEWVLNEEVHAVLNQLHSILTECVRRFPLALCGNDVSRVALFVLTSPSDQLKCVVSLAGDSITKADINFKVQRQQNSNYHATIQNDNPWKLRQIQDASNHLQQAILHIDNIDKDYSFTVPKCQVYNWAPCYPVGRSSKVDILTNQNTRHPAVLQNTSLSAVSLNTGLVSSSSEEVLYILGNILGCLQRGRSSLIVPRKRTLDELMKSRDMKCVTPSLPEDLAISFYIQSHKLVFAVYQLTNNHGTMKYDTYQAEASVPWLNEVLVLFTVGLQLCQQLKDKICVFAQYKDFTIGSRPTSSMAY